MLGRSKGAKAKKQQKGFDPQHCMVPQDIFAQPCGCTELNRSLSIQFSSAGVGKGGPDFFPSLHNNVVDENMHLYAVWDYPLILPFTFIFFHLYCPGCLHIMHIVFVLLSGLKVKK